MMTELEQRQLVVSEAVSFLGTPFHFNARLRGVGIACGPLLIESYGPYAIDAGKTLPNPPAFPKDWHFHTARELFLEVVTAFCAEVESPQPGDMALFRLGAPTRPFSHGALVVEWPNKLIHSMWRSGVEYTNMSQLPLRGSTVKFFSPWAYRETK